MRIVGGSHKVDVMGWDGRGSDGMGVMGLMG